MKKQDPAPPDERRGRGAVKTQARSLTEIYEAPLFSLNNAIGTRLLVSGTTLVDETQHLPSRRPGVK